MTLAFLMHRVLNRFGVAAAVVAHSLFEKFSSPAIRDANERAEMLARAEEDIEVWDGLPDELWPGRVGPSNF